MLESMVESKVTEWTRAALYCGDGVCGSPDDACELSSCAFPTEDWSLIVVSSSSLEDWDSSLTLGARDLGTFREMLRGLRSWMKALRGLSRRMSF